MPATHNPIPTPGSDPLTITITALLALVAVLGIICCLGFAIWWLIAYWAPL